MLSFYFGPKPTYYSLWEKCVLSNRNIDFILFTDFTDIYSKNNLTVIKCSLEEMRMKVKSRFDFPIKMQFAYKFADFRPAWGEIFSDYITGYDFWGYSDLDMLIGDIQTLLNEEILANYDKFYEYGHFTIYRNDKDVNAVYKNCDCEYPEYTYKDAFTMVEQLYFDEFRGILPKFIRSGYRVFTDYSNVYDAPPEKRQLVYDLGYRMCIVVIEYDHGKVYRLFKEKDKIVRTELIYFHFQKRELSNPYLTSITMPNRFYVLPNKIVEFNEITEEQLNHFLSQKIQNSISDYIYTFKYYIRKLLRNSYGIKGMARRRKHSKDSMEYINKLLLGRRCDRI